MIGVIVVCKVSVLLFYMCVSYVDEVMKMVQYVIIIGLKCVVVVYQDNFFGFGNVDVVKVVVSKFGVQIVVFILYNVKGDDIDMVVDKIVVVNLQIMLLFMLFVFVVDMLMCYQVKYGFVLLLQLWILFVIMFKIVFEKVGMLVYGVVVMQVMLGFNVWIQLLVCVFCEVNDKFGDYNNQIYEVVEGFFIVCVIVEGLCVCGSNFMCEVFIQVLEGFGICDFGGVCVYYDCNNYVGLDYVDVIMIGSNGYLVG